MSNLPNSVIRLVPPTLRGGYCPDSWTEFGRAIVSGTSAQHNLERGTTFYNFGNQPVFPTPEPPTPACQDFLIDWEPAAEDVTPGVSFFVGQGGFFPDLGGVETISFNSTDMGQVSYLQIRHTTTVTTISFPNLTQFTFQPLITNNSALTLVEMPNLVTTVNMNISNNASLTSINVASLLPSFNRTYNFSGNALDQATVDLVLARGVANAGFTTGSIDLSGGTNATPSVTGLADKSTLIARGVSVTTN